MNQSDRSLHVVGPALIDGFRFRDCSPRFYVLSHFHSDHWGGLDAAFPWHNAGALLYCSRITAALVVSALEVRPSCVVALDFNCPHRIGDCILTLIPANHCPGAAMLLFRLADGRHVLHCGDMRFTPAMISNPFLSALSGTARKQQASGSSGGSSGSKRPRPSPARDDDDGRHEEAAAGGPAGKRRALDDGTAAASGSPVDAGSVDDDTDPTAAFLTSITADTRIIDEVWLDTTYAHPKHTFPPQAESVQRVLDIVRPHVLLPGAVSLDGVSGVATAGGAAAAVAAGITADDRLAAGQPSGTTSAGSDAGVASAPTGSATPSRGGLMLRAEELLPSRYEAAAFSDSRSSTSSSSSCSSAASTMRPILQHARRTAGTLILVSTYVVGKERILVALARELGLRVFVPLRKLMLLQHLGLDAEDLAWFTATRAEADVHVVGMGTCGRSWPYFQPGFDNMQRYVDGLNAFLRNGPSTMRATSSGAGSTADTDDALDAIGGGDNEGRVAAPTVSAAAPAGGACASGGPSSDATGSSVDDDVDAVDEAGVASIAAGSLRYTRVVGIVPTGWVFNNKKDVFTRGACEVHLVPYSEHSSFSELVEFCRFLLPRKIIPTVTDGESTSAKIVARFAPYVDRSAGMKAFLSRMQGGTPSPGRSNSTGGAATTSSASSLAASGTSIAGHSSAAGASERSADACATLTSAEDVIDDDAAADDDDVVCIDDDDDGDGSGSSAAQVAAQTLAPVPPPTTREPLGRVGAAAQAAGLSTALAAPTVFCHVCRCELQAKGPPLACGRCGGDFVEVVIKAVSPMRPSAARSAGGASAGGGGSANKRLGDYFARSKFAPQ